MKTGAWTETEIKLASDWRAMGKTFNWIDKKLGRRVGSSQGKLMLSAVKPKTAEKKTRKCLGDECGRSFVSSGPGNRLCPRCRSRANDIEYRLGF